MLNKSDISSVEANTDGWLEERAGKFTASECHLLMGEKFETAGALSLIYRKVGEELTGMPSRDDVLTTATVHGNMYEIEGLQEFARHKQVEFMVTQKFICPNGTRIGATPDAIIPLRESPDGSQYEVETVEVKCPISFDGYIKLWLCESPEQIKAINKPYYWQVLMQILACDCLAGYLVIFHPHFKHGRMRVIKFRKAVLLDDFKLLQNRLKMALDKFDEIKNKLENN